MVNCPECGNICRTRILIKDEVGRKIGGHKCEVCKTIFPGKEIGLENVLRSMFEEAEKEE